MKINYTNLTTIQKLALLFLFLIPIIFVFIYNLIIKHMFISNPIVKLIVLYLFVVLIFGVVYFVPKLVSLKTNSANKLLINYFIIISWLYFSLGAWSYFKFDKFLFPFILFFPLSVFFIYKLIKLRIMFNDHKRFVFGFDIVELDSEKNRDLLNFFLWFFLLGWTIILVISLASLYVFCRNSFFL